MSDAENCRSLALDSMLKRLNERRRKTRGSFSKRTKDLRCRARRKDDDDDEEENSSPGKSSSTSIGLLLKQKTKNGVSFRLSTRQSNRIVSMSMLVKLVDLCVVFRWRFDLATEIRLDIVTSCSTMVLALSFAKKMPNKWRKSSTKRTRRIRRRVLRRRNRHVRSSW